MELEPRAEFYYDDKLIMAGEVSLFREIMKSQTKGSTAELHLSLGDSFTLDDFPTNGNSTHVRVTEVKRMWNQTNGQPDTTQYYLERYNTDDMYE